MKPRAVYDGAPALAKLDAAVQADLGKFDVDLRAQTKALIAGVKDVEVVDTYFEELKKEFALPADIDEQIMKRPLEPLVSDLRVRPLAPPALPKVRLDAVTIASTFDGDWSCRVPVKPGSPEWFASASGAEKSAYAMAQPGPKAVAWDGVVRENPAVSYLRASGAFDPRASTIEGRVGPTVQPILLGVLTRGASFYAQGGFNLGKGSAQINNGEILAGSGNIFLGALEVAGGAATAHARITNGSNTSAVGDGLAFRADLQKHMIGPDGFTKSGQLSGTHNLENATAALSSQGAKYTVNPTSTPGVSELQYLYRNPATGKLVSGNKTVYDPVVHSDKIMMSNAQQAGQAGWTQYLHNSNVKVFDSMQGGVNFRSYINVDKNGNAFIGNVHPIKK